MLTAVTAYTLYYRAELVAIASRMNNLVEAMGDAFECCGHWAEGYIYSAHQKGWIKGYTTERLNRISMFPGRNW